MFLRKAELQVDTILIKDLRFAFKVERGLRPVPGKAEIKIWNLNADHRGQLEALSSVGVRLKAGYGADLHAIFGGDLRIVENARDERDWITTVKGEDGGASRRSARTNRGFRPGTSIEAVLRGAIQDSGLGEGNLGQILNAAVGTVGNIFRSGTATSGNAVEEVERLADSAGYETSIQSGAFQFLRRGSALAGTAVVVNENSGMVGSPEKLTHGRVRVKTLIIPDLVPGRLITVESQQVRGTYRVEKCAWSGDTYGGDWHVDMEATSLEQIATQAQRTQQRIEAERRRQLG